MDEWRDDDFDLVEVAIERFMECGPSIDGQVDLRDFVPPLNDAKRERILLELIPIDQEYHWRAGRRKLIEDYVEEWPELRDYDGVLSQLFEAECRIRGEYDALPALDGGDDTVEVTAPTAAGRIARSEFPQLPGFEFIEEIARGGMGIVYKAWQLEFPRIVALKIIRAGRHASSIAKRRFDIEKKAATCVDAGVVPVYSFNQHQGIDYLVMQYAERGSLDRHLKDLNQQKAVEIVWKVAKTMAKLHQHSIIHRDLKPSNILLNSDNDPLVADFGLAKLGSDDESQLIVAPTAAAVSPDTLPHATDSGVGLGTLLYMAPEQKRDAKSVRPAADVYSLGKTLCEVLTGTEPEKSTKERIVSDLARHRVSRDLISVCLMCLEKHPTERYAHAGELAEDLEQIHNGDPPVIAPPLNAWQRLIYWTRQRPRLAATWLSLALFSLYHILYQFSPEALQLSADDPVTWTIYHFIVGAIVLFWAAGAWSLRRLYDVYPHRTLQFHYLWATMEVVLVTTLVIATEILFAGKTPLALLFLVLTAGSILRFRHNLVNYVTATCLAGYALHFLLFGPADFARTFGWVMSRTDELSYHEAIIFSLSLLMIGFVQFVALRRSRRAVEGVTDFSGSRNA